METLMQTFAVIIIILLVLGILISPFSIDKERKPLTAGVVVASAIINYITLMVIFWGYFRG